MSFASPQYTRQEVNRAGRVLANINATSDELERATDVLANWRACHLYPINTFQATLRTRVRRFDTDAIVAQRLKRAPSVSAKLQRFPTMNLTQMQDIGGLRAVVFSLPAMRRLEAMYRNPGAFKHLLISSKDYIAQPKLDGYRSVHLVFRYVNESAAEYNGLQLELQLRTRIQHYWATAVETMGTFLGQALKSGQGEDQWKQFFALSSAAIAHLEKSPAVPGFTSLGREETFKAVAKATKQLKVLEKLRSFAIAADSIPTTLGAGKYHLVILETATKSVRIKPFSESRLAEANREYAAIEQRSLAGDQVEAVLVSAGPIKALKKAYPNYFLDTQSFMRHIAHVIALSEGGARKSVRKQASPLRVRRQQ